MTKNISACRNIKKNFRKIDQYSEVITFNYDGGKAFYKTYVGATLTLLLSLLTFGYGVFRMHDMVNFVNANITTTNKVNFFDESNVFNDTLSLQFAFGISSFYRYPKYDDNNPDYG